MRNWRDENGQVLVMVALSMTVLLGFVAFATDVGVMLRERRIVQSAADAAAIGAATEALWENSPSSVTSGMWTAATKDATLNGFTPGSTNGSRSSKGSLLTINITPNISISGYNASGYVQAIAAQTTPTMFMNLFGFHSMDVTATAIASHKVTSNGCIYVLDSGGNDPGDTVDMNGNSLISSPNCGMTVNGTVSTSGSASIDTKFTFASTTDVQPDPFNYLQQTANQPTVPSGTAMGGNCTLPANLSDKSLTSCLYDYNCSSTTNTCAITGNLQNNTLYYYDLHGYCKLRHQPRLPRHQYRGKQRLRAAGGFMRGIGQVVEVVHGHAQLNDAEDEHEHDQHGERAFDQGLAVIFAYAALQRARQRRVKGQPNCVSSDQFWRVLSSEYPARL